MSDAARPAKREPNVAVGDMPVQTLPKSNVPSFGVLHNQLAEASLLVEDIVLKKYLTNLSELNPIPLDDSLKDINDIRLFKITEMVYQNDEYSTYKFASVFNSVQSLNCGVFIVADSNGQKTDFYMGVRSLDEKRTTYSLSATLRNSLRGQFPGVKLDKDLIEGPMKEFIDSMPSGNIATVSCVAQNKDEEFKDNQRFIQGLEKLALAMQGQRYTAIVLAKSTPFEQLNETRRAYETIYTQLSPFANMQLSYGTNTALSISDALSHGTTIGTSHSTSTSKQTGKSYSRGTTTNESTTKTNAAAAVAKGMGAALLGVASLVTAPLTGGASLVAAGAIMAGHIGLNAINPSSETKGTSDSETWSENESETHGESDTTNESTSDNHTKTRGLTAGTSDNMQVTMQNKTLINTLERIDLQLQRIDECESLGMWECAAYFLSDSQETAEMAAGTYKALMKGEKSGVEVSAINFWGRKYSKLPVLREYITNFIHPIFEYRSESAVVPVTASSLVSGNELAIQMGLPRKSLCGFPVIEHADFGKEVVKYNQSENINDFILGNVFSMGSESGTEVRLDRDSLTMHTFVTGSTGSGKSNTVNEILNQLKTINIPFLVIEPAKGEYKNVFGQFPDVAVYGTNPKKCKLLKINPFSFPADVHVLEHLDRLVELFNVCWPMYAAMPAILKDAMERAYIAVGWDISMSENPKGKVFPNFSDLLEQIESVIAESQYSADSKGDYSGALCTRVRSLTTGLNGMIFRNDELSDAELFDKNVIADLSRVGSTETKSLIMGLLVMKLNEYRMASGKFNSHLSHITVIEEAHNLFRRTSSEQSSEGVNLAGKSVELLANSIAEMRTFGEGFIIADQSPGLLDMSVIRNTNTKIILRLPEQSDRELVGLAASLSAEQIKEISKLERGVAAIYQNDWVEPVLVKISKCGIDEKIYPDVVDATVADASMVKKQLLFLLLQGRVDERLDFDVHKIEQNIAALNLSSSEREFVENQIAEFKAGGKLALWKNTEFSKLANRVTDLLGVRQQVENDALHSSDSADLTHKLTKTMKRFMPAASEEMTITILQCFMKDLSIQQGESEIRRRIYSQWFEFVKERGIKA